MRALRFPGAPATRETHPGIGANQASIHAAPLRAVAWRTTAAHRSRGARPRKGGQGPHTPPVMLYSNTANKPPGRSFASVPRKRAPLRHLRPRDSFIAPQSRTREHLGHPLRPCMKRPIARQQLHDFRTFRFSALLCHQKTAVHQLVPSRALTNHAFKAAPLARTGRC